MVLGRLVKLPSEPGKRSFALLGDVISALRRRSVPRLRGAADGALPRHAQLRPARRRRRVRRSAVARSRRSCGGASSAPPCGSSCRRRRRPTSRQLLAEALEVETADIYRVHLAAAAAGSRRAREARPAPRAARRAAGAGGAAGAARHRDADLRRHQAARHPPAPPVRVVRSGGALHRRGGRRSERAGAQDDALPHLGRRLAVRARAVARGAERQAGDGAGRDQGALRRGQQHRLGAAARGERRPRRLRAHRLQDPLQGVAGGAARGRRRSAATCTSAPATTTRRRRGSTRTCRS